jgi:predicted HTH transcriptional regulator
MALEEKKIYWDEQICEEASLKDIDEEKIRWYMKKRGIKKPTDMGYRQFLRVALKQ